MVAIIDSMTPRERRDHTLLTGSRKQRIAKGSGTSVQDVNRLIKQYLEARKMMKMLSGRGGRQWLRRWSRRVSWGVKINVKKKRRGNTGGGLGPRRKGRGSRPPFRFRRGGSRVPG